MLNNRKFNKWRYNRNCLLISIVCCDCLIQNPLHLCGTCPTTPQKHRLECNSIKNINRVVMGKIIQLLLTYCSFSMALRKFAGNGFSMSRLNSIVLWICRQRGKCHFLMNCKPSL